MSEEALPELDELEMKVLFGLADLCQDCKEVLHDYTSRPILMEKLDLTDTQYDDAMWRMEDIGVIKIISCMQDDYAATVQIHRRVVRLRKRFEQQAKKKQIEQQAERERIEQQTKKKRWAAIPKAAKWLFLAVGAAVVGIFVAWCFDWFKATTNQNTSNTESAIIQEHDDGK